MGKKWGAKKFSWSSRNTRRRYFERGDVIGIRAWLKGNRGILEFRFRIDPVPYTGNRCRSWKFKTFYKTPKTMNEKKGFYGCEDKTLVRGRRNPTNLPEAWNDCPRSDVGIKRSWKKSFRVRKQWMKKTV